MLLLFLWQQSGSEAILEETYSKKIALLVDSAKPVTEIRVNMQDALKASKDNNFDFDKVVSIDQNSVHVKLDDKGGHQYSHFNDVSVSQYPETDSNNEYTGNYIIIINENGSSE